MNIAYVLKLLKNTDKIKIDKKELIESVVLNTPCVDKFDPNISAYVKATLLWDKVPCIEVSEAVPSTTRALIDIACNELFFINRELNRIELTPFDRIIERAESEETIQNFHSCMEYVLGKKIWFLSTINFYRQSQICFYQLE